MKKINTVKESKDFEKIIKNNKSFKSKYFYIYKQINEKKIYRFGISVGKKIGNAVRRNKIKRQIKSIISKNDYQKNFDCIIIVRREINKADFIEMQNDLNYALKKLQIIKEK